MSYSAVVLDKDSSLKLKSLYGDIKPEWKWFGHHMTIKMGRLSDELKHLIGQPYSLVVTHIGKSNKAIAVRVDDDGLSTNKIPHVTLSVNVKEGGKPVDSNSITEWDKVSVRFKITGTVQEL